MRALIATLLLAACAAAGPGVPLGKPSQIGAVAIKPLALVEDSRCPESVQCIQAGTVRILARLSAGSQVLETEMTLAEPVAFAGTRFALTGACPAPKADGRTSAGSYRFIFAGEPRSASDWQPPILSCPFDGAQRMR